MDRVIQFIYEKVSPLVDSSINDYFLKWLEKLSVGNISDKRLLCCIGIDLKYELVNVDNYVNIFNILKYDEALPSGNPSLYWENALKDNAHLHFYGLENSIESHKYCRVLTIDTFHNYFYNRIEDLDDVKHFSNRNLVLAEIKRDELLNIRMPNDGPPFRRCAWITPYSKLEDLIQEANSSFKKAVNIITDYLGLPIDPTSCEYILIEYPDNFSENTYQPSSVNSKWEENPALPGLFISFKKQDKYGRTRPRIGDTDIIRQPERIHEPIPIRYSYNIKYLGIVDDSSIDLSNIEVESLNRFLT